MDVLDQMRELREKGQPFVLATVVRVEKPTSAKPGAKAIITEDGGLSGWIGGSCAEPSVRREALKVLAGRHAAAAAAVPAGEDERRDRRKG